jgi:hypothetical protein
MDKTSGKEKKRKIAQDLVSFLSQDYNSLDVEDIHNFFTSKLEM